MSPWQFWALVFVMAAVFLGVLLELAVKIFRVKKQTKAFDKLQKQKAEWV